MTTTTSSRGALSAEQLEAVLGLLGGVDSAELKLTIPESDQQDTVRRLGMDPLDAQIRQVFFFDTPDLALNNAGVVARARRVQGKGDDSVVKLRPVEPDSLPDDLRSYLTVEVDAMPGAYVCSASLKGAPSADVREVTSAGGSIRKLFSKKQRAFFASHAPDGIAFEDLSTLGPITVFKLKFSPKGYDRKLVAELWMYPDYSRVLELSTKCSPRKARQVAAEAREFLESRGVDLSADQQTKTAKALRYFTERL